MSEIASNTSLIRAVQKFRQESENLNEALTHAQGMNLSLAAEAITKWLATCPREKARRSKALLVELCALYLPSQWLDVMHKIPQVIVLPICTESLLHNSQPTHAPPHTALGADRATPMPHLYPMPIQLGVT